MHFTIAGPINLVETIAKGRGIRSLPRLRAAFGGSNWRKMKGVAVVELQGGLRRSTGMKRTASAGNGSKSNGSSAKRKARNPQVAAALCLDNGGNGDLEPRKLYKILPDKKALADGFLRVVDESGEDYLYPTKYFAVIRVPAAAAKALVG